MERHDVIRLARVLAIQTEVESMKVANMVRLSRGEAVAYNEEAFACKANDLENLAYCHDEQL